MKNWGWLIYQVYFVLNVIHVSVVMGLGGGRERLDYSGVNIFRCVYGR